MRFANNILENYYRVNNGYEPWGQLSGMKKLLAKGENGKFWAKDFDIKGHEMVGLSYLPYNVIKPTGVTKEIEITLEKYNYRTCSAEPFTKKITVKEWELLDYDRLKRAYDLIMELIML